MIVGKSLYDQRLEKENTSYPIWLMLQESQQTENHALGPFNLDAEMTITFAVPKERNRPSVCCIGPTMFV